MRLQADPRKTILCFDDPWQCAFDDQIRYAGQIRSKDDDLASFMLLWQEESSFCETVENER